ncbi:serine hydrolase domain-containing protein [Psychroflexus halocasei]|uniref:CubicO group peptidase, beta-lactamase class C family n=1 Tax=Psychroflexus halocasei TaxID=908615 RepID=A0A1H4B3G7_9FLAO|nr:serine hydrolase [Psychroflexus halocasei]SEA42604.1 CubicO group peptidase, beta-lactamase class C family [Psychroflexus halocasei]
MFNSNKNLILILFLIIQSIAIQAQECRSFDEDFIRKERENIPGETMGQKLESLLFWSQKEKERRFPMMYGIYPSLEVKAHKNILNLENSKEVQPEWEDGTTLNTYMSENHIAGVIVLKDEEIRLEKYAENVDEKTLWTSFSMAKSVSSMLLGVALKEGDIKSLDDHLKKYIHEFEGYDYGEVSVRQLLTMTSGIGWSEDYEDPNSDVAQMYQNPCVGDESHILTYMKSLEFEHKPGTHWNYSTGETDLVGILIQKATGKSLAEYLSEKIWKPWGMEHCAYWLADECSNLNIGGSGLSASLRDYARLGHLMLNKGQRDEMRLLSEEWMADATSLLQQTDEQGGGYGYLWWRFKNGSYAAVGIFGQMLYVNPDQNLVIAQVAAWPKASSKELVKERLEFIKAVEKVVE